MNTEHLKKEFINGTMYPSKIANHLVKKYETKINKAINHMKKGIEKYDDGTDNGIMSTMLEGIEILEDDISYLNELNCLNKKIDKIHEYIIKHKYIIGSIAFNELCDIIFGDVNNE